MVEALRTMVLSLDTASLIGARDHAVLLYRICLFGRRSELADLRWTDLAGADEGMTVCIRMSKTDREAIGETVPVLWDARCRGRTRSWSPVGGGEHVNSYSAHSLRAGAATIAYKNGAPISTICRLGRWKEGSRVVLGHIRDVAQWKDHPFRAVL